MAVAEAAWDAAENNYRNWFGRHVSTAWVASDGRTTLQRPGDLTVAAFTELSTLRKATAAAQEHYEQLWALR